VAFRGFGRVENLVVFPCTGNAVFDHHLYPGAAKALSFKDDFVGTVPDSVQGRSPQEFVVEGFSPFREVQVAGDDGRAPLIPLGDQIMKILIL